MKNLTKTLLTVMFAVLMIIANSVSVHAVSGTQVSEDKATVRVEEVEANTTLKLYKIVEPDIDSTTNQMKGYKFTSTAEEKLIDPDTLVTLTFSENSKNYTITKKASELDANNDGIVDSTIILASETVTAEGESTADTLSGKEWTVGSGKGKAIYDMEGPTQRSINLAVSLEALGNPVETSTAAAGTDYVQADVYAGQYIGILTAPDTSNTTYNPVVLSAGYKGYQKYKIAETGQSGTHYLLKNGEFTEVPPTADTLYLYDNKNDVAWNSTTNSAKNPTWVQDGNTTEDRLIAGYVDPAKDYSIPQQSIAISGTKAVAKKSTPDMKKTATTDYKEENMDVALVATDEKGDPKYVPYGTETANQQPNPDSVQLVYVKKPFTGEQYNETRNGTKFYKLVNGTPQEATAGDPDIVSLKDMETYDAHLAQTTPKDAYSVSQGERIDYRLEPTIPQYPVNAKNKTLTFTDKMGNGISFVPGSIDISFGTTPKVIKSYDIDATGPQYKFYVDTNKTYPTENAVLADYKGLYYEHTDPNTDVVTWKQVSDTNIPDGSAKLFDLVAEAKEQAKDGTLVDGNNFQINFKYDAIPGVEGNKVSPIITYNAVLNENAICGIPGNVNVATMYYAKNSGQGKTWDEWRKPSGEDYKKDHDEGVVYTYEIKFRKTNDKDEYIVDNEAESTAATTFYLLKGTATVQETWDALKAKSTPFYSVNGSLIGYLVPGSEIGTDAGKIAEVDRTSAYVKNGDFDVLEKAVFGLYKTQDCNDEDLITKITTNKDGYGHTTDVHGDDTYYLKELVAPAGYSLNTTPIPVKPTWTSATTWSTDTVTRYVYSVVDYTDWDNDEKTHTGWLVTETDTSTNGKYYDMNGNANDAATSSPLNGEYFGDGNGDGTSTWVYNYSTKTMTKGNVVIKFVFPAVADQTTTTTTKSDTVYNNNGGTLYLVRINNTKTSELPSTGGIGTYLFTIAGVAIIATAAFMLIFRKKEEHNH